ncbi:MAG: EutN/CcmL family microcompartment protein, partial [Puniceicoccales bacterium]
MKVGRVVGRVVLADRIPELPVGRWLLVSPLGRKEVEQIDQEIISNQPSSVVFDNLGASQGDLIGYTEGGEATKPFEGKRRQAHAPYRA